MTALLSLSFRTSVFYFFLSQVAFPYCRKLSASRLCDYKLFVFLGERKKALHSSSFTRRHERLEVCSEKTTLSHEFIPQIKLCPGKSKALIAHDEAKEWEHIVGSVSSGLPPDSGIEPVSFQNNC